MRAVRDLHPRLAADLSHMSYFTSKKPAKTEPNLESLRIRGRDCLNYVAQVPAVNIP